MSYTQYEEALERAEEKYILFLLVEKDPTPPKDGTHRMVQHVLSELVAPLGELEEEILAFIAERPTRVQYARLEVSRKDTELMARAGITWLPQIRLCRRGKVLLRSAVQMADNGHLLASDVGGKSFRRSTSTAQNLFDVISFHTDSKKVV